MEKLTSLEMNNLVGGAREDYGYSDAIKEAERRIRESQEKMRKAVEVAANAGAVGGGVIGGAMAGGTR